MARRVQSVALWPGVGAAAVVVFLALGTLLAVAFRADGIGAFDRFDVAAVRFTVVQAILSACLSVAFAIPAARALARRRFRGREALVTLLGAPFILPVIVAILGLTAVFGTQGIVSKSLSWAGLEPISIYGLHGVLIAHVFFNLPLATRLLLHGWSTVPAERFRLAASLGFGAGDVFKHIERPMLREVVPGALAVIFLVCTTSFAVALTFGGGPKATTVELAIYEAFRYDFDLGKASLLSVIQFAICGVAAFLSLRFTVAQSSLATRTLGDSRVHLSSRFLRVNDAIWIILVSLFLLTPLVMLFIDGAKGVFDLPATVWMAAVRSVATALASTAIAIALALSLALATLRHSWFEGVGMMSIAASPLVMGTGLFLIVFPFLDPAFIALPVTATVNAVMALPFTLRILLPAVRACEHDYGALADSVGMRGWTRLRVLVFPHIRKPLGFAAGLSAALSMGDLGVITLFARPEQATLPLQIYRLMGAYRMEQAMGAALVLLVLSLLMFFIFDKGLRSHASD